MAKREPRRRSLRKPPARPQPKPKRIYQPTPNDNLSRGFSAADLIPDHLKGTEEFLDVLTWNIRYFHHYDQDRVFRITEILNTLNADIIVLQEILENSLEPVADGLRGRGAGHYQIEYGTTGGNQRIALMWDLDWVRAKDEVKELFGKGTITTPQGKDAFPRLPLWGNFIARPQLSNGEPFDFQMVGVHLKSQRGDGGPQRVLAAESLGEWLEKDAPKVDSDVIIIGDWNETPNADSWKKIHELEESGEVMFKKINSKSEISHLYYKNKKKLGSRLDLTAISIAAYDEVIGDPEVVRWTNLEKFLDTQPKAKEIKAFLKEIREEISDHLPVVTRFYFEEKSS